MNSTMQNKIMDLGVYLVGRNENLNVANRMIANPQDYGRRLLGVCAITLKDSNARRMAADLAGKI